MKASHTSQIAANSNKSTGYVGNLFQEQLSFFEQNRFGMMAAYMIAQSCIGSIACMKVLEHDNGYFLLAVCVAVTMASNAFFIAQTSAKSCLIMTYVSVAINLLLIAFV